MLSKHIEEFGLSCDNQLIHDIVVTWGGRMQDLTQVSECYLIAKIITEKILPISLGFLDRRANKVIERLDELTYQEALMLAKILLDDLHNSL